MSANQSVEPATTVRRRGWREVVEPGLYRAHSLNCPASRHQRPGRRCACPFEILVPSPHAGRRATLTIHGTVAEARTERRRRLAAGRPSPPATPVGDGTLDDFATRYLQAKAPLLAGATIRNREDDYRLRIGPTLGHYPPHKLSRERVELWLAQLAAGASSRRMVVQTVATLRAMLAAAVEWKRLPDNPAAHLRLPPATQHEQAKTQRVLDQGQLAALIRRAGSLRTETMLRAAAEAGLRKGEVIGLRWGDVNLTDRRLEVRRAVWQERRRNGEPHVKREKGTKGGRARRVAISPIFAARLADWYAQSVIEGGADATGYVWPGRRGGQPMNERSPNQALTRALSRAGLLDADGGPLVTFHGLRHTAASIMLSHGVPLIVVSRQLGHANTHITATIYAHLLGDSELDLAARAFDAAPTEGTTERPPAVD